MVELCFCKTQNTAPKYVFCSVTPIPKKKNEEEEEEEEEEKKLYRFLIHQQYFNPLPLE